MTASYSKLKFNSLYPPWLVDYLPFASDITPFKINIAEKVDTVTPSRIYCTSLVSQFHVDGVEDASTVDVPNVPPRRSVSTPLSIVFLRLSQITSHPD
ncbi:hypothetical protein NPIL_552601 [Nephila pilipes]|uniref:Uncharacterized protein n=1 Tax=Nephila pilipes TaxID=299642 RepID=A0A8X6QS74_NEPPI|nr:hypothetical protein NPIL_552601 [Nephila pilipes]